MRKQLNHLNVRGLLDGIKKRIDTDLEGAANYLGQEIVNHARHTANFKDHTGNLRNSIGYVVASGSVVKNVINDRGHPEAQRNADEFAESVQPEHGRMKTIVYAGMDYGPHVEAKGYDVITQSVQKVPEKLREALKR